MERKSGANVCNASQMCMTANLFTRAAREHAAESGATLGGIGKAVPRAMESVARGDATGSGGRWNAGGSGEPVRPPSSFQSKRNGYPSCTPSQRRFWSASAAIAVPDVVVAVLSDRCRKNWYVAMRAAHGVNRYVAESGMVTLSTSMDDPRDELTTE